MRMYKTFLFMRLKEENFIRRMRLNCVFRLFVEPNVRHKRKRFFGDFFALRFLEVACIRINEIRRCAERSATNKNTEVNRKMNLGKKILSFALSACMVLSSGSVLSYAGEPVVKSTQTYCSATEDHQHVYDMAKQKKSREATCKETGIYTDVICEKCSFELDPIDVGLDADNHVNTTKVDAVEPTCTSVGNIEYYICNDCGKLFTYDEDGKITYLESEDDAVLEMVKHDYDVENPVLIEELFDCLKYVTYKCKNCEATERREVRGTADHTPEVIPGKAATCTGKGLTDGEKCSVCGKILKEQEEIPALGHTWGDFENVVTDIDGVVHYQHKKTCTVCGREVAYDHVASAEGVYTEGTCTENGYWTYTCDKGWTGAENKNTGCGNTWVVVDENSTVADNHPELSIRTAEVPATCVKGAYLFNWCEDCGATWDIDDEDKSLDPDNHKTYAPSVVLDRDTGKYVLADENLGVENYWLATDEAVTPTCTEKGSTAPMACDLCGAKQAAQEIEALGHNWGEWTSNGDGTHTRLCKNNTAHVETADCTEDNAEIEVFDAHCDKDGYTVYTCKDCGYEWTVVDEGSAPGHNYGDWTKVADENRHMGYCLCEFGCNSFTLEDCYDAEPVYTEAVCEKNAYYTYTCDKCGNVWTEEVEGTALEHEWVKNEDLSSDPTCLEHGFIYYDCALCNARTKDVVSHLGHDYVVIDTDKAATCTENGYAKLSKCQRENCGFEQVEGEIEALGHDFTEQIIDDAHLVTPADCENAAVYRYDCSRCDAIGEDTFEYGEALGHDVVVDEAKEATCTETGLTEGSHCDRCGKVFVAQEVIPAKGHTEVTDAAVEATCTESGLTEGKHCSVCEAVLVAQEEIPALGHDLVNHEAQAATCEEIGWDSYDTCTRCDYTTYVEIEALGHSEKTIEGYAADYHTTGLTDEIVCDREGCGKVLVPAEIIPCKDETITFTYTFTGRNDDDKTANGGTAILSVYATSEHACLYGTQIELEIGDGLVANGYAKVSVDGFNTYTYTAVETVNKNGKTVLLITAGNERNVEFSGENVLFAQIVFDVEDDFVGTTGVTVNENNTLTTRQDDINNSLVADFGTGAEIDVKLLGDADANGTVNVNDVRLFNEWDLAREEGAYDSIFDYNNDGVVDGVDFILMRNAIVGNEA